MSLSVTKSNWPLISEESLLKRASTLLWIPVSLRLLLTAGIAQMYHFYYRAQGVYSNPEAKIDR
ncbi:hypothetical protein DSO57_1029416 [Entomophthora muscae]|uniref:Uncharacterized protein n=1 Tax=Entomophthora muscae TaxID=34485 RepID=A0ACC2SQD2_9FUNG|nr:hypothetical protein DSO57_1029416 [Entomophthora muscae]